MDLVQSGKTTEIKHQLECSEEAHVCNLDPTDSIILLFNQMTISWFHDIIILGLGNEIEKHIEAEG